MNIAWKRVSNAWIWVPLTSIAAVIAACSGQGNGGGNCDAYGGCSPPATVAPTVTGVAVSGAGVTGPSLIGGVPTVSGTTVTVTPTISASSTVTGVQYLLDNTLLTPTAITTAPYTFTWDTTTATEGAHSLEVRVSNGNVTTMRSTPVVVANAATLTVRMNPNEELSATPGVLGTGTVASGTGNVTVNLVSGAVSSSITLTNFRSDGTAAGTPVAPLIMHIHQGFAGDNGPVIVNYVLQNTSYFCGGTTLCAVTTGTNPQLAGAAAPTITGTVTNISTVWAIAANTVLTAPQLTAFTQGGLYLNAHSTFLPGGEIRTQLKPANIRVVFTNLTTAQEVPVPVATAMANPRGFAAITVNSATPRTVTAHADTNYTTGLITAAHIHRGVAGTAGPIMVNFAADPGGAGALNPNPAGHFFVNNATTNAITGLPFSATDFSQLANDEWYVNVHTATNVSGEIRGQVVAPMFLAAMSGGNEVAPNNNGSGYSGSVVVTLDPVTLEGCVRGVNPVPVTDTVTDSHIHIGNANQNGTVVFAFGTNLVNTCSVAGPVNVTAPTALGTLSGAQIVNGIISNPSGHYYNIHTTAFPAGALRGQLVRTQ